MSQLTIKGTATAADLAGGEVVFTIGSKTYKTAIDNSLKYSIALEVPAADSNKPFTAIATGTGNKSWVQLAAIYPSITSLIEKAGSDKILNVDEFFGVNITPISTAQYAEVKNNNAPLENDQQLKNAMLDVHPVRPLEGASLLLRLLATNGDDFELPKPATTTLDFFLNAGLYEAYTGIADLEDSGWADEYLDSLQSNNTQTFVPAKKLAGNYFIETKNLSYYLLSLRDDGTGQLKTRVLDKEYADYRNEYPLAADFTWQQNGRLVTLTFNNPVKYIVDRVRLPDDFYTCDDHSTNTVNEACSLTINSIELDLISETEFNEFARVRLIGNATNSSNEKVREGTFSEQLAHLTVFNKVASISSNDLIGHEWYTPEFSYKLLANGAAQITNLRTNAVTESDWVLDGYHVKLKDAELLLINTNPAGYDIVHVIGTQVYKTFMFKRSPVTMTESDWIGRWTGFPRDINSNAQDVNADKTWGDGFEASAAGNWKLLDGHRQSALANGDWRMIRDVLAIHDGKYYMSICHGIEATPFVPMSCYLSVGTRAENFDSNVFWGAWSYPAFNEKVSGQSLVPIGDRTFKGAGSFSWDVEQSFRIASDKLFNRNKGSIIELTSANKNEIELCEYYVFESCSAANKRLYTKGIQVKVTPGFTFSFNYFGYGFNVPSSADVYFENAFMLPKGRNITANVAPLESNRIIQSVTGCDGTLVGSQYTIPARSSDCEISVTFTSSSSSIKSSSSSSSSSIESSSSSSSESGVEPSSSSSSSVVPSSSSSSSSLPATTQLTIQGKVVAEALAGGKVVATIGAQTFTAIVDANKNYKLDINISNKDINQPFSAVATGADSNRWVKLAALYPSIEKLASLAGDTLLDASEYAGVNISPSTTAEYAIIQINRSPLNTDADRKSALLQIDAADKLNRAAYLVRLLTDINTNVPPQFPTTLDLVLDKFYIGGQVKINNDYDDDFQDELNDIKSDSSQSYVSNKTIVGEHFLRAGSFNYLLTFNANGTGLLRTSNTPGVGIWPGDGKYHEATFSWIRKQKQLEITLDSPIIYGKTIGFNNVFQQQCAYSTGVNVPACSVRLYSILLSLIDENEVGKIVDVELELDVADVNYQSLFNVNGISYTAALLDTSQFYKVTADELSGLTWYTNNYSYQFNADGTATQINLYTKNSAQVTWQLDNGRVRLDGEALEILPLYVQGPGFVVMQLLQDNERALSDGAFQQTSFFKRESVTMAEADWVGRWNRGFENYFSAASDFYANGKFRDSFETQLMGSWTVVDGSRIWALSNGTWRSEYDVLAIKDGQYYLQNCYGENAVNFVPTGCVVESYVIDKTFTGATFWESWSNPLFENMATGDYWQFWGHSLNLYNGNSIYSYRSVKKVAPNLFLDVNNWKILEMLSSDLNSIEVCEYNVGDTCNANNAFTLARAPEIKFNISGSGLVRYDTRDFQRSGSMMVRKEAKSIYLQPATGQELLPNNISGCGGNLNGNFYEIPAPQADCEITVTFTPF
ncbi:MAG: hypothetical protein B0W54_17150 [Cellvibrio sp. 79]|nr:MAG: hypothetical protein B0W54_17150 [Cellvibrio sp. 79]